MQLSKLLDPERYERSIAELNGETILQLQYESEKAPEEAPPAPKPEENYDKIQLKSLSVSDSVMAMTCVIATLALFLYDSKGKHRA